MPEKFNRIRPGYELVNVKLQWNVQVPFLYSFYNEGYGSGQKLDSILFSPQETPNRKWQLRLYDRGAQIEIYVFHRNSTGREEQFLKPTQLQMSILNRRGKKVLQQIVQSTPLCSYYVQFGYSKGYAIKCQQEDGSLTFYCKIITHVKIEASADPPAGVAINCLNELSTQLGELFDKMPSSDVNFNIGGREFPAHKLILAARSKVFEAKFKHSTKENVTNQIDIEDIKPEVFQELLRFIYTGRVSIATMETMAVGLFIAADKYLLSGLKNECENYLIHDMSPDNCIELLLNSNLMNSSEQLKNEAAKSFV
jgi:speckle-type POZ protein